MATLVLLHGAPGEGALWAPVVEALGPGVRVVTPTLRWFGGAEWSGDGSDFGTEAHADELLSLLDGLGEGPVAVAAWSYSAHPVLLAALDAPDRFARIFLYEPGLGSYLATEEERAVHAADAAAAFGPVFAALHAGGPEAALAALFDASGGAGCFAALSPERRALYLESARVLPLLLGGGRPPAVVTADDLARIDIPVTVAHGDATRPLFRVASEAVARAVPGARRQVVEGADHMLPETDPRRFAAILADFLAR